MDAPRDRVRVPRTSDRSGTINFRKAMTAFRATGALEKFQLIEPITVLQLSSHVGSA